MKTINKILILLMAITTVACEDVLQKNITDDTLQIVYPLSNASINSNAVNFQWNNLTGASNYRVQVMAANASIVVDSLVTKNNLNIPLSEGTYQWRVRAENNAYTSTYTNNISFSIYQTSDLTNQQVILSSPTDAFYTNNANLILSWQNLSAATSYSFELTNVTNGESIVNQQANLTNNSLTLSSTILSQDAQYRWKIKGVNTTTQTPFAARTFYLDKVNPNQPTNLLPADSTTQTINQQISFSWSITPDSGTIQSPISYVIEFANDINFTTIIQTSSINTTSFQQSFATTGDYYWRISAKDQAGNTSTTSTPFKFTIN